MAAFATRAQFYVLGLPAEALIPRARAIAAVDIATGIFTLRGHGYFADTPIRYELDSDPIAGGPTEALPGGLAAGALYYAQPVNGSSDLFRVSTIAGGSPLTSFSTAPVGVVGAYKDPGPATDMALEEATGWVAQHLTAHPTGVQPDPETGLYPIVLAGMVSRVAGRRLLTSWKLQNPLYKDAAEDILKQEGPDTAVLMLWKDGRPVVGVVDQTPQLAEAGAVAVRLKRGGLYRDPDDEERV